MTVALSLERAEAIPGWMDRDELEWLATHAAQSSKIIEVGCWMGRSTRALADATAGTVWCVDSWTGTQGSQIAKTKRGTLIATNQMLKPGIFAAFVANLSDHISTGHVQVLPARSMFSVQILRCLAPFDVVFLDGDHAYASIAREITDFRPLVRPGGILAGHDYGNPRWVQVTRAVDELVPDRQVVGQIWWTRV